MLLPLIIKITPRNEERALKNEPCFVMLMMKMLMELMSKNCGKVDGYEVVIEFVDYYSNRFRIER